MPPTAYADSSSMSQMAKKPYDPEPPWTAPAGRDGGEEVRKEGRSELWRVFFLAGGYSKALSQMVEYPPANEETAKQTTHRRTTIQLYLLGHEVGEGLHAVCRLLGEWMAAIESKPTSLSRAAERHSSFGTHQITFIWSARAPPNLSIWPEIIVLKSGYK